MKLVTILGLCDSKSYAVNHPFLVVEVISHLLGVLPNLICLLCSAFWALRTVCHWFRVKFVTSSMTSRACAHCYWRPTCPLSFPWRFLHPLLLPPWACVSSSSPLPKSEDQHPNWNATLLVPEGSLCI